MEERWRGECVPGCSLGPAEVSLASAIFFSVAFDSCVCEVLPEQLRRGAIRFQVISATSCPGCTFDRVFLRCSNRGRARCSKSRLTADGGGQGPIEQFQEFPFPMRDATGPYFARRGRCAAMVEVPRSIEALSCRVCFSCSWPWCSPAWANRPSPRPCRTSCRQRCPPRRRSRRCPWAARHSRNRRPPSRTCRVATRPAPTGRRRPRTA